MPPFNYNGGRLLTNVQLTSIFARVKQLNSDGSVQSPTWVDSTTSTGQPISAVCSINAFLRDLLSSAYIGLVAQEYSPPGGSIGYGSLVASRLIELPFTQPANGPPLTIQYTDVEAMLNSAIQSGVIPGPAAHSCYMIFFADISVQDQTGGITGQDAGGFHAVFTTQAGVSATYCVIDASDVGGANTTWYASHELVEAITNPNNSGFSIGDGWYDKSDNEVVDVCSAADNLNGPPTFHGHAVASFWVRSQSRCGIPADDNVITSGPVIRLFPKMLPSDCATGIPCNVNIDFAAVATVAGVEDALTDPQWVAQNGAQIVGGANALTCSVLTPQSPSQFGLGFTAVDSFGCPVQNEADFVSVSAAEIAWLSEVCKLKHLILEYWRFINPLWDPLRDFTYLPVNEIELNRARQLAGQMNRMVSLLERQPPVQPIRAGVERSREDSRPKR